MRISRTFLLPGLVLAVGLFGCSRPAGDATTGPALDQIGPTENSGAVLIRRPQTTQFFNFDAQTHLLSAHAPSNICGEGSFNVGDLQIVITPSEIMQFLVQIKDRDAQVAVYHANSLADAGLGGNGIGGPGFDLTKFCEFMSGPNLIAEGMVQQVQNLSNANFSAHWGGSILGVDGTRYHLSESYQLRASALDPSNPDLWVVDVDRILLTPTP